MKIRIQGKLICCAIVAVGLGTLIAGRTAWAQLQTKQLSESTCDTSGTCGAGKLVDGSGNDGCSDYGMFGCYGTCSTCAGASTNNETFCRTVTMGTCIAQTNANPTPCGARTDIGCARSPGGCCPAAGGTPNGTCGVSKCSLM